MCVKSLLCGPRADLWPFYGFLCKRFSLYIKVNLFERYATMPILANAHISSLGYLCKKHGQNHTRITAYRIYKRYYTSIVDAQLKLRQEKFLRDIQFRPLQTEYTYESVLTMATISFRRDLLHF